MHMFKYAPGFYLTLFCFFFGSMDICLWISDLESFSVSSVGKHTFYAYTSY